MSVGRLLLSRRLRGLRSVKSLTVRLFGIVLLSWTIYCLEEIAHEIILVPIFVV